MNILSHFHLISEIGKIIKWPLLGDSLLGTWKRWHCRCTVVYKNCAYLYFIWFFYNYIVKNKLIVFVMFSVYNLSKIQHGEFLMSIRRNHVFLNITAWQTLMDSSLFSCLIVWHDYKHHAALWFSNCTLYLRKYC